MEATTFDGKTIALAQFLKVEPEQIEEVYGEYEISDKSYYGRSYKVLTDNEADAAFENALDDYIEQVIWPEIPEAYQLYFAEEAWKRDARINSSRGNELSWY